MEWIFAALLFLLGSNGDFGYEQAGSVAAPSSDPTEVSTFSHGGGYPPPPQP